MEYQKKKHSTSLQFYNISVVCVCVFVYVYVMEDLIKIPIELRVFWQAFAKNWFY